MFDRTGRKATTLIGALLIVTAMGWGLPGPTDGYTARRATRTTVHGHGGVHHRDVSVHRDIVVNGLTYQNFGGAWYQPMYAGTQVTYVVVSPPR